MTYIDGKVINCSVLIQQMFGFDLIYTAYPQGRRIKIV